MGVKFGKYIRGNYIKEDFKGKIFAIDASNAIMQFLAPLSTSNKTNKPNYKNQPNNKNKNENKDVYKNKYGYKSKYNNYQNYSSPPAILIDRTQRYISHLYGIFYRTIKFLEAGVIPVYCFDGIPEIQKRLSTKNRVHDFKIAKERYERYMRAGDKENALKIALGREFLWKNSVDEIRILLKNMGIPIINSPGEAEAQCASLVKKKIASTVISTDFDCLLFGSPNFFKIDKILKRTISGSFYSAQLIQNKLGLNRYQLVDLSFLIGNDYFPGIKGLGFSKGIELLKKYGSLLNILKIENIPSSDIKEIRKKLDIHNYTKLSKLFLLPVVKEDNISLTLEPPKEGGIINLLCIDHNLNRERVLKGITRLKESYIKLESIYEII